jgi:hypothetical protein
MPASNNVRARYVLSKPNIRLPIKESGRWAVEYGSPKRQSRRVSGLLVLIVAVGWMIPVAIYAFTLKMRSKYERRITKLCSIINLSDRERYISELGGVVVELTPRPILLERFLPDREEPVTDKDYYEFFHNQIIFQRRH